MTGDTLFDADPEQAAVRGHATLSHDGRYRYSLSRDWTPAGEAPSVVHFIMLNPSTADAFSDDPTIRRCVGFARRWGRTCVTVSNLYALRATNPRDLWRVPYGERVGPDNDRHLRVVAEAVPLFGSLVVAAWGAHAEPARVRQVLELPGVAGRLQCLGVTKAGAPRHPLYVRADTNLRPWPLIEGGTDGTTS